MERGVRSHHEEYERRVECDRSEMIGHRSEIRDQISEVKDHTITRTRQTYTDIETYRIYTSKHIYMYTYTHILVSNVRVYIH
jgi:hypothetical protein